MLHDTSSCSASDPCSYAAERPLASKRPRRSGASSAEPHGADAPIPTTAGAGVLTRSSGLSGRSGGYMAAPYTLPLY